LSQINAKLLILVDSLNVNTSSGARVNMALLKNLNELFELTVIHNSDTLQEVDNISFIKVSENRVSPAFMLSRSIRLLRRHIGLNLSPMFENIFGFSFTFLSTAKAFLKSLRSIYTSDFDLVITLSQGESFVPHFAMLKYRSLYNIWLAYIHDPYPAEFYPKSYSFKGSGSRQKIEFMRTVMTSAKYLGFPGKNLADWMQKKYELYSNQAIIIPHQINIEAIERENIILPDFFNVDDFNILHAGNLLKQRDPSALIEAFELFLTQNKGAKAHSNLYFIGHVSEYFHELVKGMNSMNIHFMAQLNYNIVQELQRKSSVNVILESNDEISPFLPGKITDCVNSGRPILALSPKDSELRNLLRNDNPFQSAADDINVILRQINQLYKLWVTNELTQDYNELKTYLGIENLNKTMKSILN
jgi:glycosyltransferase involved in cell wall biosynthesis